ncbi:MAG: hypothetical protein HWE33_04530 [Rhodobacteraceae bacterium]|nr:hypothetical protein [Paracoccaceae bacterium]
MTISMMNLTSKFNSPPPSSSTPIFANREGSKSAETPIFTGREGSTSVSTPIFTDRENSTSVPAPIFTEREGSNSVPTPVFTLETTHAIHSEITDSFLMTDSGNSEETRVSQTVSDHGPGREITAPTNEAKPEVSKPGAHHLFDTLRDRIASSHGKDSSWFYSKMHEHLSLSDL